MTRLRGASFDSPNISHPGGPERANCRSKVPPNAPEVILQNTIDVPDASRVLSWDRDERRRNFNVLVRKYKNQLLYGCDDPGCRTPTCASRRRRISEGPYRRYTELSARTLACYLASLDDAESGLCCNTPKVPSESAIQHYHRISLQRARAIQAQADAAAVAAGGQNSSLCDSPSDPNNGNDARKDSLCTGSAPDRNVAAISSSPQPNNAAACDFHDLDYAAEQPLKDPKSFTQNLFDTISLRMVEWLPLRRTAESYPPSLKRSNSSPQAESSQTLKDQTPQTRLERRSNPLHAQTNSPSAGQPTSRIPAIRTSGTTSSAVELKIQNQHVKRVSVTEVDNRKQPSLSSLDEKKRPEYSSRKLSMNSVLAPSEYTSMPSPPALKHRSQKHRGRISELENSRPQGRAKNQRRVSWDSEKLLNETSFDQSSNEAGLPPPTSEVDNASPRDRKIKRASRQQSPEAVPSVQTISHLTPEIIDAFAQVMFESREDRDTWQQELDRIQSMGTFDSPEWTLATSYQRQLFPFIAQSVFFVFSSARHILRSFRTKHERALGDTLDIHSLRDSLRTLFAICPWDIALHSFWGAIDKLFLPPNDYPSSARHSRRSSRSSTMNGQGPQIQGLRRISESVTDEHLSDADAAYIATVALFVLIGSIPRVDSSTWRRILQMRAAGGVASSAEMLKLSSEQAQQAVEATDRFEHELALRLVNRLVRALTARLAYHEIIKARQAYNFDFSKQRKINVIDRIMDHLSEHNNLQTDAETIGPAPLIVEWFRTLFLREWDGNPEMARSSATGGAIQILAMMYKERARLGLAAEDFETPLLSERLDPLEMPVAWMGGLSNNRTLHLLSYPFLFPPSFLVIYFRALNYSAMSKYYEAATTTTRHVTQTAFSHINVTDDSALLARLKVSMSTYLVLVVRRDNVLTDALNQLWRREKRELMRPLKVQMGMDEGEEGLDHGGVQQEFFRVLMGEALDPVYGMFTMDSRHRISWFRPCALEPLYKFELLGLLMSIAVYNGLTLPINFPLAFYRKLLGLKVKRLDHIRDGWPELTQGLESLLSWTDGDVGDIFMRTYEFSFENFGGVEAIDMQKVDRDAAWPLPAKIAPVSTPEDSTAWADVPHYFNPATASLPSSMAAEATDAPSPSVSGETIKSGIEPLSPQLPSPLPEEAALVTNENRDQFVKDYIFWLTDKSIRPQFEAFSRGFHTCLDRSALSVFTPEALKAVVEGIQTIDIKELENHARYEGGFSPDHRVIRDFWSIVRHYSEEKKARLLEFVTASDRVPVNGISSIMFVIQKNGVGDSRLPTSLTCFGRLLLSEYTSKEALAEKLDKALENAQGFGVA
ncbi:hypothetical protein N7468_006935 [Penicillium chermesinum]|uniref:HECT-type E3 ubiquitin transferase n=1 Tax=Penicillium chermesinum TaxID=63820 RepID=A0A9W9TLP6_9EURO|nr:uncharacterized protein N7468_006935 [Penicillium chermesinum]KAJ5225710.1 hypothetical protein N7468_006935 [Penicillium chermesinum]KAJ6161072.1 hypothetical protein N7470_004468 [Penicillium chermesinum]